MQAAAKLFEADTVRQTYAPGNQRFVVSPENSRQVLTAFIKGAKEQLLIYDQQVSDNLMQRVLMDRAKAGVEIRILGKLEKTIPKCKVGFLERPERVVLLIIGCLFDRMAPVLWVLAVLSNVTVIHRMIYTWRETKQLEDAQRGTGLNLGRRTSTLPK